MFVTALRNEAEEGAFCWPPGTCDWVLIAPHNVLVVAFVVKRFDRVRPGLNTEIIRNYLDKMTGYSSLC